jgi:hypothetical protein
LEAELAPVFQLLEASAERARELREQAEGDATAVRGEAEKAGRQILAEAQAQMASVRAAAMAARLASIEGETARIVAAGRAEAERIDRGASEHIPRWAEELVAQIMALPAHLGGPGWITVEDKQWGSDVQPGGDPLP